MNDMRKLNILFISDCDTKYGAPHSFIGMIKSMLKHSNVTVTVILSQKAYRLKDCLQKYGCRVYEANFTSYQQRIPQNRLLFPVKYILHFFPYMYGRIVEIRRVEKGLNISEFDIIHSNSSREDFGLLLAIRNGIPLIQHIREFGDIDYSCYRYRHNFIELLNKTQGKCIAVSNAVNKHWKGKGVLADKIVTVYNGVPPQSIKNTMKDHSDNIVHYVMVGSIQETKGQFFLIEAINNLSSGIKNSIHVDIIGDGKDSYVRAIEKKIKLYHLENVVSLIGYIDSPYEHLEQYDVGLMCSKSEAFGRVTAEYMMSGIPVIASNSGANKELVRDGIDGLLYEYGNYNDLCNAIIRMNNSNRMRVTMGCNGHKRAMDMFDENVNAHNIINVYNEILGGGSL